MHVYAISRVVNSTQHATTAPAKLESNAAAETRIHISLIDLFVFDLALAIARFAGVSFIHDRTDLPLLSIDIPPSKRIGANILTTASSADFHYSLSHNFLPSSALSLKRYIGDQADFL